MKKRSCLAVLSLAVGAAVAALSPAPSAHAAGAGDGTLSSPDVLDHIAALDTDINSDPSSTENRNANTRADGAGNNSLF